MQQNQAKDRKLAGKIDPKMLGRSIVLGVLDAFGIAFSFFLALWMRFDFKFQSIPENYLYGFTSQILFWVLICIAVFVLLQLYQSVWIYVSITELIRILIAYAILCVVGIIYIKLIHLHMPRTYYVLGMLISAAVTTFIRFFYRAVRQLSLNIERNQANHASERVMVIGAGEAGRGLVNEFRTSQYVKGQVVCLIDDNAHKLRKKLLGVPIVGGRYDIPDIVEQYHIDKIIFAIPTAKAEDRKEILDICSKTGCSVQIVPGMYQILNGEVHLSQLRKVNVQDLLGRDQIKVDLDQIFQFISGKVILVTGGGGSIGSELCRQIARHTPKQLIIFDIYENNAYDIQQELKRELPNLNLVTLIGSVRNTIRVDSIMETYHPDIIFHAAAHKHVPLMEDSPNEAIKNNVFGTYNVAKAADKYGVKRMVLISTDKAVNPTNIMGASKRLCEMVVQMMSRRSKTEFVAVRFGNVLGSNGSVIPLFERQIEQGGPVTVTHPDIIRYFMTIPEAVSLVLQASYYAHGGEIFILDMGEPVKIDDMARSMIRLSGYEPDVDIKIVYTGLRPGEKLYEELLMKEEGLQDTNNKLIHIGRPIEMDDDVFCEQLMRLKEAAYAEVENMKDIVEEMVPTYKKPVK